MAKTSEQTCACCSVKFMGTRLENRCPDCKAAGRRPRVKFKPTKAEIAAKRKAREAEREALKAEREAAAAELALATASNDASPDDYESPEQRHRRRRLERFQHQREWLDRRSKKPKGYSKMLNETAESPLGQLWLSLCHADGQVNCLTRNSAVPVEDREKLLLIHYRLRAKGYAAYAIAKLCPQGLLSASRSDLWSGLEDLPQVTCADPHNNEDLSETQSDAQERQRLQSLLGL